MLTEDRSDMMLNLPAVLFGRLFSEVTRKIVIIITVIFFWAVQVGISAPCQFWLCSIQELFASFLFEPATPAAHVYNRHGQIKGFEPQE